MRVGAVPEGPLEWVLARTNAAPQPLLETQMAYTLARLIMVGAKVGVFEALAEKPLTAEETAERCNASVVGMGKLLFALNGAGYVSGEGEQYSLTPMSRKWLTSGSEHCVADKLLLQFLEWDFLGRAEDYVRTGEPIELHSMSDPEEWELYQKGMRAMANAFAPEAVKRMPVPKGAAEMLDIGGSHGYYSVSLCRRHDGLRSTVLDLPDAVEQAAPLLAAEGMGERVVHKVGDALTEDLGSETYDLILVSQLVHHFSEEQNRELAKRIAAALRPNGVHAVLDEFRPRDVKEAGQIGAMLEFYFALTSQSGTWAVGEIADWQASAGLKPRRPILFRTAPGVGVQAAVKTQ